MVSVIFLVIVVGFLGTPVAALFSFTDWAANRAGLPTWRNILGLASLLAISLGWLFIAILTVLRFIKEDWRYVLTERRDVGLIILATAATVSCLALRGSARSLGIFAGILLFILALFASFWLPGDWI